MNALLIHGYGNKGTDAFFPTLMAHLEKQNYEVDSPDLPIVGQNGYEKTISILDKIKLSNPVDLIIGHSSGCYLALKLAEKYKVKKIILVAPQISANLWGQAYMDNVWNEFGQTDGKLYIDFHSHDIDFDKVRVNTDRITIIRGDQDPYIPKEFVEEILRELPKAKYLELRGKKHLGVSDQVTDVPEIYQFI